jgi:hypothetical protein
MTVLFPALAVTFAALCVWLVVRIINRRERWAKWTLAAVVGVPVLYVASFGPACWIYSRDDHDDSLSDFYLPMGLLFAHGPRFIIRPVHSWARLGMVTDSAAFVPVEGGRAIVINGPQSQ